MTTNEWMDSRVMTQQPMPEIPGYPYQSAPGYVPATETAAPSGVPAVPATEVAHAAPTYDVSHNYVVPTVTETYYASADTYAQPAYTQPAYAQPVYTQPVYQQPVYQQPVVEQPVYEAPVYQQPVYQAPVYQDPAYAQPVYQQPVSYAPAAAAPAAAGLSRTEQRKREEAAQKSAKKSKSLFKAWWLYPLVAAIVVCSYLGWKSAQVPVNNAPSTPVVVDNQP